MVKPLWQWAKSHPQYGAAWVVGISTLLHLLVIGRFDLSVDEAHYALYGLRLDWSYFDHPPLIGWLQALVLVISDSEFALRLWPVLLSVLVSWSLYRLARVLFPGAGYALAALAVVLLQSAVLFQVLSMGLVPEMPLLLFGLLGAFFLFRSVHHNRPRDWLRFGILLGLAGLSKYTGVTLTLSALLLVWVERRWSLLRSPWPWLAVLLAAVVISPVLWWNAHNDWLSFAYQLGHGAPDRAWELKRFLTAQAGQLLGYGPLLVIPAIAAVFAGMHHWGHPAVRFLLVMALPIFVLFGWMGGYETTLPHWTLLGWALLAPLAAWWLLAAWRRRWVRGVVYIGAGYSLLLVLVIHSLLFSPWLPFDKYKNPLGDLIGWREAANRAGQLADRGDGGTMPLYVGNWSIASRIAWYARPLSVQVIDERYDQFDLWFGSPPDGGDGLLIVPDYYRGREVAGLSHFEHCNALDSLTVSRAGTAVHSYDFYYCEDYRN